jgi:hypothetical protein
MDGIGILITLSTEREEIVVKYFDMFIKHRER